MAKSLSDLPAQTAVPIIFSLTVYWIVGYQDTAAKFFYFAAMMILTNMVRAAAFRAPGLSPPVGREASLPNRGQQRTLVTRLTPHPALSRSAQAACSLGLAVSAICRRIQLGMVVLPMAFEICRLYGSYFLPPALTPHWLRWIDVLSFCKYAHIGIVINEFTGLKMTDYRPTRASSATAIPPNWQYGEQYLESQGYAYGQYLDRGKCAGILFVYIIIYRMAAYLGVRYLKH